MVAGGLRSVGEAVGTSANMFPTWRRRENGSVAGHMQHRVAGEREWG